jgi:hypothetical protein
MVPIPWIPRVKKQMPIRQKAAPYREGSQDPRPGNFGGVPEYDTADEEKKKDGKGTFDHSPCLQCRFTSMQR